MSKTLKTREQLYDFAKMKTKKSIFFRERIDPSKTYLILGKSFSGKTTYLVENLNKLVNKQQDTVSPHNKRPIYDLILFMTESTDADPIKGLDKTLPLLMIRGYYPRLVLLLKKIQDASKRAFRFLVILDDIVQNVREGVAKKQILTLRNSHISTCLLMQYPKLISPAMRSSIHELYILKLRPTDWEYLLQSFLNNHAREVLGNIRSIHQLVEEFMEYLGPDIMFLDQRRDEMGLIKREDWAKEI